MIFCHAMGWGSAGGVGRSVVQAETATPGMVRRYRQISRAWLDSTENVQYLPSNAKIGLRCFHAPTVKSGNSSVWKLLAIDCSDNGVIALQVTAS